MSHARTTIRALLVSRLTNETPAAGSVFNNRVKPMQASELPAINVMIGDEGVRRIAMGAPARLERRPSALIDIYDEDEGPALEAIAEAVEQRLAPGGWGAAALIDITLVAVSEIYDDGGRKVAGRLRLTFELEYHTAEGSPGTILN